MNFEILKNPTYYAITGIMASLLYILYNQIKENIYFWRFNSINKRDGTNSKFDFLPYSYRLSLGINFLLGSILLLILSW